MKVTPRTTRSDDFIDPRHYWRVLMQHKLALLLPSILIAALVAYAATQMDDVYRASTTLLIENDPGRILDINEGLSQRTNNKEYFLTQFEILKSRELAQRVIRQLNLGEHPEFDPDQAEPSPVAQALRSAKTLIGINESEAVEPTADEKHKWTTDKFLDALTIAPVSNTQLAKIQFEAKDPELVAEVTNTMAQAYIDSQLEARSSTTRQASSWLNERLDDLKQKLKQSEQELQAYREQQRMLDTGGQLSPDFDQLEQLTETYLQAKNTRSELESVRRQVQAFGFSPHPEELLSLPTVMSDDLVRELKTAMGESERRVAELSDRYGPKHPKMIAAQSQLDADRRALYDHVTRIAQTINNEYEVALNNERAAEDRLEQAKENVQNVNRKGFRLNDLEREVASNRSLYEMFLNRAKETSEASGLMTPSARIVDPAVAPREPVKPQRSLLVALAFCGTFAFCGIGVITRDALDSTINTPEDIEEKLGSHFLGFIPYLKGNKSKFAVTEFLDNASGPFAEAIRNVRTAVTLPHFDENHKIIVVTSAVPNEGKSTVALNLAAAMGQTQKILLIDTDMRRPTLAKTLDEPTNTPGLMELVANKVQLKDCIKPLRNSHVHVITSGSFGEEGKDPELGLFNPLELLSTKRFDQFIQQMALQYDYVILDTAPVCGISDAVQLSQLADSLVFVVQAHKTDTNTASRGLKILHDANAPVSGVVLNMVDLNKIKAYQEYVAYYPSYGYGKT